MKKEKLDEICNHLESLAKMMRETDPELIHAEISFVKNGLINATPERGWRVLKDTGASSYNCHVVFMATKNLEDLNNEK